MISINTIISFCTPQDLQCIFLIRMLQILLRNLTWITNSPHQSTLYIDILLPEYIKAITRYNLLHSNCVMHSKFKMRQVIYHWYIVIFFFHKFNFSSWIISNTQNHKRQHISIFEYIDGYIFLKLLFESTIFRNHKDSQRFTMKISYFFNIEKKLLPGIHN